MSAAWGEKPARSVLAGPALVWIVLLALLAVNLALTVLPLGPFSIPLHLLLASIQVGFMAVVFMRLDRSSPLVRLAAASGLVWLSFLFILASVDFLTRP